MMTVKVNIVEDIKEVLAFYGALGLDGLPINSEKRIMGKKEASERPPVPPSGRKRPA